MQETKLNLIVDKKYKEEMNSRCDGIAVSDDVARRRASYELAFDIRPFKAAVDQYELTKDRDLRVDCMRVKFDYLKKVATG